MRKNQLSLKVTRHGDQVPEGYPQKQQIINIYSDSNNLYEAMMLLNAKLINVIEEWESIPSFGRCNISTNFDVENNISSRILQRRYEENTYLEYAKKRLELDKKLLMYIDNSTEIIELIKKSNKDNVRENLMNRFDYNRDDVDNILRINFGIMTMTDIENIKKDILELESLIYKNYESIEK